jgi:hypothetical protein
MGGKGKKNKGFQQPGGCLLYGGIPVAGFLIALNFYCWAVDYENPYPWITPLIIMLMAVALVVGIAWARKGERDEHKRQVELKKKQWLDSLGSKRIKNL